MKDLSNEFVTYEIALALKELGFDEECFGYYNPDEELIYGIDFKTIKYAHKYHKEDESVLSPIWGQVIDWLREKHDIDVEIHSSFGNGGSWWANLCYNPTRTEVLNIATFENYYQAREQAILKAIELCKNK